MNILVPRVRSGKFRPSLLPEKWSRHESSIEDFIKDLILTGMSTNKIKQVLKTYNVSLPETFVEEVSEEISNDFKRLTNKELPEELICLIVDCKQTECILENGQIGIVRVYQVFSIDFEGNREICYFEVSTEPENSKKWLSIFSRLVERGLRRVLLIVTDNLAGMKDALKTVFNDSLHQLCVVHMKRSVYRNMTIKDAKQFCEEFDIIKMGNNYSSAVSSFVNLCNKYEERYPTFIKQLKQDAALYTNFIRFPNEIRKYLYSTNIIEGLNNLIECIRKNSGGYFRGDDHLLKCFAIFYNRLKMTKWSNPHPHIRGFLRELRQIFVSVFKDSVL